MELSSLQNLGPTPALPGMQMRLQVLVLLR
jgi:hypothetical protein